MQRNNQGEIAQKMKFYMFCMCVFLVSVMLFLCFCFLQHRESCIVQNEPVQGNGNEKKTFSKIMRARERASFESESKEIMAND